MPKRVTTSKQQNESVAASKPGILKKQYLTGLRRDWVYGGLGSLLVIAVVLFLFVPHYKTQSLATQQQINQAHKDIIQAFFVKSTTCSHDTLSHHDRVLAFNKYFAVNGYANRAVIRGCNDNDALLATNDAGKWYRTDVHIVLMARQNPQWQKTCLIADITRVDTKARPENASIDANNQAICDKLLKTSYVHI